MAKTERILVKTTEQKVLGFIDRYKLVSPGERVLVALSGGPDSVFVLNFFYKYKSRFGGLHLGAAHINHCLRGKDSDMDEAFCKGLTETLGIEFYSSRVDVKGFAKSEGFSIEEAARNLRYQALTEIAEKGKFNKIATAHNMSDNAETVLLNLIKGTGLKGISGIPVSRGNIIRPVLALSKPEILQYLDCLKIAYRIDETNKSNDFERNFIRNVIIPEVKSHLNPSVELSLFNSSENFRNAEHFIASQIGVILDQAATFSNEKIEIDLNRLQNFDNAAFGDLLKRAVEKTFSIDFGFKDLVKISSLIDNQPGRKILLRGNVTVFRERSSLIIQKKQDNEFSPISIRIGETRETEGRRLSIFEKYNSGKYNVELKSGSASKGSHEMIAADDLSEEFILRRWKSGDKFVPLGMKNFKKISDFLSEQKVPASEKKKQLVLTNRDEIVWVPGFRIDDRYRITENSKRILEVCLE